MKTDILWFLKSNHCCAWIYVTLKNIKSISKIKHTDILQYGFFISGSATGLQRTLPPISMSLHLFPTILHLVTLVFISLPMKTHHALWHVT